jgi:hypothetical protein
VIGDFYQSSDYSMIAHKNQINAIIVRDPLEESPIFGTELSLKNAQNNSSIPITKTNDFAC